MTNRTQAVPGNRRAMDWRRYLKTPKGYVILMLGILLLLDVVYTRDARVVLDAFVAMVTATAIDAVVAVAFRRRRWLSDGGIVTGLIIAGVLSSTVHLYVVAATTAVAVASKHVLKVGRKPIFNPAAVGLLAGIYAFHVGESWSLDLSAFPVWGIVVLGVIGYLVTDRVNKFPQVFAFIAVYLSFFVIEGWFHVALASDAFRNPILNSAMFLAFFMMTDPPTSPARYRQQIVFGVLAAIVSSLIYLTFDGLSYLLIGLLFANAWKAWDSRKANQNTNPAVVDFQRNRSEPLSSIRYDRMEK